MDEKNIRCLAIIKNYETLEVDFEDNFPEIDEWKGRWRNDPVTYSVIRDTEDLPGKSPERTAMNLAMTTWDLEIKPKLKWVRFDRNPDITIEFKPAKEDELFRDRPSVLAYAYFPEQGDVSGVIVFNDDYWWGLKQGTKQIVNPDGTVSRVRIFNVIHTMIHEIGHSLGLRHSVDCPDCVMHPYYNNTTRLHDFDVYRIRRKYGIRIFRNWSRYNAIKRWLALRHMRFE